MRNSADQDLLGDVHRQGEAGNGGSEEVHELHNRGEAVSTRSHSRVVGGPRELTTKRSGEQYHEERNALC